MADKINLRPSYLFRTSILTILIILTLSSFVSAARLPKEVVPIRQSIYLKLDANQPDYTGSTVVQLQVEQPTSQFQFHAENLQITKLTLSDEQQAHAVSFEPADSMVMTVTCENELPVGEYTLTIEFADDFNTNAVSLYRAEAEGRYYLYTQMEANEAREAFPCWDEPCFKIPYQLTIAVPDSHLAISNTPVENEQTEDGWTTFEFAESKPMPSYLIAIATGTLDTISVPGTSMPMRIVTTKGKTPLTQMTREMAPKIMAAAEKYFELPYPYRKLDLIAVHEFWPGGMENAGAITFAERILLKADTNISLRQKRHLAGVLAHEFAHMWFGDLVTMEWWDDLWLNESFADWAGDMIANEVYPELGIEMGLVERSARVMSGDARSTSRAIRSKVTDASNLLDNIGAIYGKGSSVLRMFESWVGREKFREGIVTYLKKYAWQNAIADDFFGTIGELSGKDFSDGIASFIDQPGLPLVGVELIGNNQLRLTQRRFSNYGTELTSEQLWKIPVNLKIENNGSVTDQTVYLTDSVQTVELTTDGAPKWVYPMAGASGYYRWVTSPEMLLAIASDAPTKLTTVERKAFLGNLSALLDAGVVHGDDYLRLLNQFAADDDLQVLSSLLDNLQAVAAAFVPDSLRPLFGGYIAHTLKPAMDRVGYTAQPGEDNSFTILRPQLIAWLATDNRDPETVAFAKAEARKFMDDPTSVDPSLIGVAMGTLCRDGDQALWDECRNRFENATLPQLRSTYLYCLGAFDDSTISAKALDYTFQTNLATNELFAIPMTAMSVSTASRQRVDNWFMDNYDSLLARVPPVEQVYFAYIASGCSQQRLDAYREFFSDSTRYNPPILGALTRVASQVGDCVDLREREGAAVIEYLRNSEGAQ